MTLNGFRQYGKCLYRPVEKSGYFKPFYTNTRYFTEAQKLQLTQRSRLSRAKVLPLYQNFYDFMTKEYIPNAGKYRGQQHLTALSFMRIDLRYYTTLNMTSAEVQ